MKPTNFYFRQPQWALKSLSAGMETVQDLIHPLLLCLHGITFGQNFTTNVSLLPFPLMISAEFVSSHPQKFLAFAPTFSTVCFLISQ
jgi:hypothetical protein